MDAGKCGQLLELMSRNADVQLAFQDGAIPAHSQILATWSGVLAGALLLCPNPQPMEWGSSGGSSSSCSSCSGCMQLAGDVDNSSSGGGRCSAARRVIPMPGTSTAEWLEVAQFLYPVIPSPAVTWDNAEGLLALGAKYDMPALLAMAGKFLTSNMCLLDMAEKGDRFVWHWLRLADAAGLDDVAQLCINRVVHLDRASCASQQRLAGLSSGALQRLVVRLAAVSPPVTPLSGFTCKFTRGSSPVSSPASGSPRGVSPHRWLLESP